MPRVKSVKCRFCGMELQPHELAELECDACLKKAAWPVSVTPAVTKRDAPNVRVTGGL